MPLDPPTPEPQPTAQGCLLGILALVITVGIICFAIGSVLVTVKWALGR